MKSREHQNSLDFDNDDALRHYSLHYCLQIIKVTNQPVQVHNCGKQHFRPMQKYDAYHLERTRDIIGD